MSSIRASAVPVCATALIAAALLTGCAGEPRLSSQLPAGVRLAGDWKLDPAHSDDLGKAVEELHAQQAKAAARDGRRHSNKGPAAMGGTGGRAAVRKADRARARRYWKAMSRESAPAGSPRSSAVDELMSNVPQGDYLRIKVSSSAFTVISGDSTDEYTPGVESDISAVQGDAQQFTGWKGTDYVIDTRPQLGAEIIQTFSLTKDGTLSMTVRLSGNRIHFTFTRIYDRTTGVTPLAPPTIN